MKTSLFLSFLRQPLFSFLSCLSRVRRSSAAEMFRVRSQADASSAKGPRHERRVGHYIDLRETGNRAWKVASTQSNSRLACERASWRWLSKVLNDYRRGWLRMRNYQPCTFPWPFTWSPPFLTEVICINSCWLGISSIPSKRWRVAWNVKRGIKNWILHSCTDCL